MFPNLETEQVRCGYSEEYVAEILGMSERLFRARKKSGAFRPIEVETLVGLYKKPVTRATKYRGEGNFEKAIADLEAALMLDPNNAGIKNGLERLRARQEEAREQQVVVAPPPPPQNIVITPPFQLRHGSRMSGGGLYFHGERMHRGFWEPTVRDALMQYGDTRQLYNSFARKQSSAVLKALASSAFLIVMFAGLVDENDGLFFSGAIGSLTFSISSISSSNSAKEDANKAILLYNSHIYTGRTPRFSPPQR